MDKAAPGWTGVSFSSDHASETERAAKLQGQRIGHAIRRVVMDENDELRREKKKTHEGFSPRGFKYLSRPSLPREFGLHHLQGGEGPHDLD